ncbi:unnamed protein product [Lactuca saligna]|uniref:K Homology domain-containing protein n=1 Tax=Lactuca saligna TaxID=75948 RepID=A0AA36EKM2_LACSI|nr:unnamed protein product [Lactuca saligna]
MKRCVGMMSTGARIQVIPLHPPPGDTSTERTVQIDGSSEQIEAAKQLVNEVISENRPRNSMGSGGGGYSQQATKLDPIETPGPHPHPKCNKKAMVTCNQVHTPVNPLNTPNPNTEATLVQPDMPPDGTSPVSKPHRELGAVAAGGYDYYNQQRAPQTQPPGGTVAAAVGSGYGYSHQGQGYDQDGYGGYSQSDGQTSQTGSYGGQGDTTVAQAPPPASGAQSGYVQPPPPAAASYGSYGAQPPSGYGGYGQKPLVTPPAYGQSPPQQSPNAAPQGGGYAQPAPYSGYGQADASGQHPPYGGVAARVAVVVVVRLLKLHLSRVDDQAHLLDGRASVGASVDSARQNLAATFTNDFVNVGFGQDKLKRFIWP